MLCLPVLLALQPSRQLEAEALVGLCRLHARFNLTTRENALQRRMELQVATKMFCVRG